jgi:Arc/MetJ-type ribon-helix-helix transcriptional regulator
MANSRRQPTSPEAPTKQIGVRVPAHVNDQLDALAQRENNSISAVVRRLLTKALREDAERVS